MKSAVKVLSTFEGLRRTVAQEASAGEIVAIAGIEDVDVGDTIVDQNPGWEGRALPRIHVEQPTIKMRVGVNTSPFAGKSKQTKYLTSRHLRERLQREAKKNLAIRVDDTETPDTFQVLGRGELQLAILDRDDAPRGLRASARQPRGRDPDGRRPALRADGARRHRRARAVHRRS